MLVQLPTLSLHDALPIWQRHPEHGFGRLPVGLTIPLSPILTGSLRQPFFLKVCRSNWIRLPRSPDRQHELVSWASRPEARPVYSAGLADRLAPCRTRPRWTRCWRSDPVDPAGACGRLRAVSAERDSWRPAFFRAPIDGVGSLTGHAAVPFFVPARQCAPDSYPAKRFPEPEISRWC